MRKCCSLQLLCSPAGLVGLQANAISQAYCCSLAHAADIHQQTVADRLERWPYLEDTSVNRMLAYADAAPSPNCKAGGDASIDTRGCCRYIACPAVLVLGKGVGLIRGL